MADKIFLTADGIAAKKCKNAATSLLTAGNKLGKADFLMLQNVRSHTGLLILEDAGIECCRIQSEVGLIRDNLLELQGLISSLPEQIFDADQSFGKWLDAHTPTRGIKTGKVGSHSGMIGVWDSIVALFIGTDYPQTLSIDVPTYLSSNDMSDNSDQNDEFYKVTVSDLSTVGEVTNDVVGNIVDSSRDKHGKEGITTSKEHIMYSSVTHGTKTVLGEEFSYKNYTDYSKLSYETTEGDTFYAANGGFQREIQHIDFESQQAGGFTGSLSVNAVNVYADGEFDPQKGLIYAKAGADYNLYAATVDLGGDGIVSGSITGSIGAGATLDVGIHDGKFSLSASAGLVAGLGFSFEFDYREFWKAACDAFSFK